MSHHVFQYLHELQVLHVGLYSLTIIRVKNSYAHWFTFKLLVLLIRIWVSNHFIIISRKRTGAEPPVQRCICYSHVLLLIARIT